MRSGLIILAVLVVGGHAASARAGGQANVLTQHNDVARSGVTFGEEILSPSTVAGGAFGKVGTLPVDGRVYAQPLYVEGVEMDAGARNVVYIATEHDSIYAFDADTLDPTPLFMVSLGTSVPSTSSGNITGTGCPDLAPEVGITATPTIDPNTGLLYVEVRSVDAQNAQSHTLHALDLRTGADVLTPAVISATVTVAGHPDVVFDPTLHNSRPGLLLANGNVYVAFASLCDYGSYHGWIFSYSASTLEQQNVFVTTPAGSQGGIWQGGGGLVADSLGNIYASIGNGTMDLLDGGQDISEAMARWTPDLQLTDWFSPYNESPLSNRDLDLGPCPTMLLEDQGLLIGSGKGMFNSDGVTTKEFPVYVANSNDLGHQHALDNDQLVQTIDTPMPVKYGWSGMATFPGPEGPQLFLCGPGMPLTSYPAERRAVQPGHAQPECRRPAGSRRGSDVDLDERSRRGARRPLAADGAHRRRHELRGPDQRGAARIQHRRRHHRALGQQPEPVSRQRGQHRQVHHSHHRRRPRVRGHLRRRGRRLWPPV